jgi:hypothetical protein
MSEDPKLFDAGDYNLFRYCHNDPVDKTDPMGLQEDVEKNQERQNGQPDRVRQDIANARAKTYGLTVIGRSPLAHEPATKASQQLAGLREKFSKFVGLNGNTAATPTAVQRQQIGGGYVSKEGDL